jgi:4-hydroxyproline epimerase
VPAYRHRKQVALDLPGHGVVHGDVAWGGNWFFLVSDHGQRVAGDNLAALTAFAGAVREALAAQGITGAADAEIDHIELFADDDQGADSRNFVLCPGLAYDRSPCGTGTSAKIACLAADGELAPGQAWQQASVIGSRFEASYALEDGKVIPTLRGRAHISAEATLLIDGNDPFGWGIRI